MHYQSQWNCIIMRFQVARDVLTAHLQEFTWPKGNKMTKPWFISKEEVSAKAKPFQRPYKTATKDPKPTWAVPKTSHQQYNPTTLLFFHLTRTSILFIQIGIKYIFLIVMVLYIKDQLYNLFLIKIQNYILEDQIIQLLRSN